MLPFHAIKNGPKKRRLGEVQDRYKNTERGGPIQVAITDDLIALRKEFRKKLVDFRMEHGVSSHHWKTGTAFSIFKDIFRSSKFGMIHLLPPPRSDREAYSQLIYSACLALFKESFGGIERRNASARFLDDNEDCTDGPNHYDDTAFAIFALYCLFETNPLPRGISSENPLELLPISLRSSEDPRAPYRRCFSKNVRVDRQHFASLLRLKEFALAKKSNGEKLVYDQQRVRLEDFEFYDGRNYYESAGIPVHCSCGMSNDIIQVLERIYPRLQLCEYTGPVGAQAFAGHAEYPHNKSITTRKGDCRESTTIRQQPIIPQRDEGAECIRFKSSKDCSTEISSLSKNYKKILTTIRIPPLKSNAVTRLKGLLEPLHSQTNSTWLHDIREEAYFQHTNNYEKADAYKVVHSKTMVNYGVSLDGDIDDDLKKVLHDSVMLLLKRDELCLCGISNGISKSSIDTDDVSSIGYGGISTASRLHRPIMLDSKKSGLNILRKEENISSKQGIANLFLTSTKESINQSDEDSVHSEITILSNSDSEGINEGAISVVSSAFGEKALQDLLQNAIQADIGDGDGGDTNKYIHTYRTDEPRNEKKIRNRARGEDAEELGYNHNEECYEETSLATPGFGKEALEDLLKNVTKPRNEKEKRNRTRIVNTGLRECSDYEEENEEVSLATSGFGKEALKDLLENVANEDIDKNNKEKYKIGRNKQKKSSETTTKQRNGNATEIHSLESKNVKDGEVSVATTAFGKKALDDLLQNVTKADLNKKKKRAPKITTSQRKRNITQIDSFVSKNDKEGEVSVATTTFGERALEELLQNVTEDVDDNSEYQESTNMKKD